MLRWIKEFMRNGINYVIRTADSLSIDADMLIGSKGEKMIEMLNCDCMDFMRSCPDKSFELAIVDNIHTL